MAADAEGLAGKPAALLQGGLSPLLAQDFGQTAVLCLGGHNHHVLEVLGGRTDERYAADVYLLNDVGLAGPAGHSLLEGVEVHDDQVNLGNLVLLHLGLVTFQCPAAKYATEHLRMQCLHATTQNAGIARHVLHLAAGYAQSLDEGLRATRAEQFHTLTVQLM